MLSRLATFFPADLPDALPEVTLPASGRYLLLSDLHLGDGSPTDLFGHKDGALLQLLEAHAAEVEAVILDGDVLDATQAGGAAAIKTAHGQVVARLRALAERLPLYHVAGNHDSLGVVEALLPGVALCAAVRLDDEALVIHGHQLDVYFHGGPLGGRGQLSLRAHAALEHLTGQFIRLPFALHDNPTNRFAHWLFYRVTMGWHRLAQLAALAGHERWLRSWAAHHDFWARSQWGDPNALLLPALQALARGTHRVLITGHSHQAGLVERIAHPPAERVSGAPPRLAWRTAERRAPGPDALRGRTYVNLGAWVFEQTSYGLWDRRALQLRDWRSGRPIGDRAYRRALAAEAIPGMRAWWGRYYRGCGRYASARVRRDLEQATGLTLTTA